MTTDQQIMMARLLESSISGFAFTNRVMCNCGQMRVTALHSYSLTCRSLRSTRYVGGTLLVHRNQLWGNPIRKPIKARPKATIERVSELEMFSMANALKEDTGLPMVIYISERNAPHGPRIKVSRSYGDKVRVGDWFEMTVENDPRVIGNMGKIRVRDLHALSKFIEVNKDLLLAYWHQNPPYSTKKMLNSLVPV